MTQTPVVLDNSYAILKYSSSYGRAPIITVVKLTPLQSQWLRTERKLKEVKGQVTLTPIPAYVISSSTASELAPSLFEVKPDIANDFWVLGLEEDIKRTYPNICLPGLSLTFDFKRINVDTSPTMGMILNYFFEYFGYGEDERGVELASMQKEIETFHQRLEDLIKKRDQMYNERRSVSLKLFDAVSKIDINDKDASDEENVCEDEDE